MAEPYYVDEQVTLWLGDSLEVLRTLPASSVNCCVTSPPYYGLRDYGEPGQYGLEPSPLEYVETMRAVFAEVRRVLADDGTLWLNVGDSYASEPPGKTDHALRSSTLASSKRASSATAQMRESVRAAAVDRTKFLPRKNLLGIPWRVAFALQSDGWILRNAIIWDKPNAMPESVRDRLSTTYELVFMLAKSRAYWFDVDPIREAYAPETATRYAAGYKTAPKTLAAQLGGGTSMQTMFNGDKFGENPKGRNPGDVWTIATSPFPEAHFAVMAPTLAERCILAGCKPGGTVLDPFAGSGTTGMVAAQHGRRFVGIDLSREYLDLALRTRLAQTAIVDEVTDGRRQGR